MYKTKYRVQPLSFVNTCACTRRRYVHAPISACQPNRWFISDLFEVYNHANRFANDGCCALIRNTLSVATSATRTISYKSSRNIGIAYERSLGSWIARNITVGFFNAVSYVASPQSLQFAANFFYRYVRISKTQSLRYLLKVIFHECLDFVDVIYIFCPLFDQICRRIR